jgi:hypothetical protein
MPKKKKRRKDAPWVTPPKKPAADSAATRARKKANTARRRAVVAAIVARTKAGRTATAAAARGADMRDLDHLPVVEHLVTVATEATTERSRIKSAIGQSLPVDEEFMERMRAEPAPRKKARQSKPREIAVESPPDKPLVRRNYRCTECGKPGHNAKGCNHSACDPTVCSRTLSNYELPALSPPP